MRLLVNHKLSHTRTRRHKHNSHTTHTRHDTHTHTHTIHARARRHWRVVGIYLVLFFISRSPVTMLLPMMRALTHWPALIPAAWVERVPVLVSLCPTASTRTHTQTHCCLLNRCTVGFCSEARAHAAHHHTTHPGCANGRSWAFCAEANIDSTSVFRREKKGFLF